MGEPGKHMLPKEAPHMAAFFEAIGTEYRSLPAFSTKDTAEPGGYRDVTYHELIGQALDLAAGLIQFGVKHGDHVAVFADNRIEWMITDIGIVLAGAAGVPRGTDVTDQDIKYIVPHSGAKIVFVENTNLLERITVLLPHLPDVTQIVLMQGDLPGGSSPVTLAALLATGKRIRRMGSRSLGKRMKSIRSEDLFTLIYTSGTTGAPKGVMLTHGNMMSQIRNMPLEFGPGDIFLSILPIWHIYERAIELMAMANGAQTVYSNVRSIRDDMCSVRPTWVGASPRFWESVYKSIMAGLERGPESKRKLFWVSYRLASAFHRARAFVFRSDLRMQDISPGRWLFEVVKSLATVLFLAVPFLIVDAFVLRQVRSSTGGRLKATISGGAALPGYVDDFLNNIGIRILEGYGMTETSPIIALRTFGSAILGTVGRIFPETELRLVDTADGTLVYPPSTGQKGEIHVRGPQVMRGYYRNPEATHAVIRDGWMNTGDLGIMTATGCLKIVGRSKETIVLLSGENVEPVPIENRILESAMVDHCMVVGQDMKFLAALVVPSVEYFADVAGRLEEIAESERVQEMILAEIRTLVHAQNGFKSFEKVLDCRLVPKAFTVGDELTNLMKLKRTVITDKYQPLIREIYF